LQVPLPRLAVHAWPGALPVASDGLLAGLLVIQIATDGGRANARAQLRLVVRQVLCEWLALAPDQIGLTSTPGQAPRLVLCGARTAGLSISHEAGLALAAINLHGRIGVDLMRVPELDGVHDGDELIAVARDYLGPAQAAALAGVAPGRRPMAFAKAWAAHEASLKCRGLALAEWRPAPSPVALRIIELDLPAPFVGAVATPA
jgi:4'-phosphopantetheinyl transferase